MKTPTAVSRRSASGPRTANLMVRVDLPSKEVIARAARIRGISVSDYIRSVVVVQARREVDRGSARWSGQARPPRIVQIGGENREKGTSRARRGGEMDGM